MYNYYNYRAFFYTYMYNLNNSWFPRSYKCILGVKVQNMKMDFNTEGTWRQVGQ